MLTMTDDEQRPLTNRQVGLLLGAPPTTVSRWCSTVTGAGRVPEATNLAAIAAAFDVPAGEVLAAASSRRGEPNEARLARWSAYFVGLIAERGVEAWQRAQGRLADEPEVEAVTGG